MARTLIVNGIVISPTGADRADVLVDDETIAALFAPGQVDALGVSADQTLDARGKYVLPGGVDVHTHMSLPMGSITSSDTFASGTRAAAWGGTTTIIDFANQFAGEMVQEQLALRHDEAAGQCCIDYAFHQVIGGVDEASLRAMDELVQHEGITSFKMFMAYPGRLYSDDGQILRAMQKAADNGAVIMMHAENGIAIDVLAAQAVARGDTSPAFHSRTRPSALEGEATHRAIMLAKVAGNTPLYIVHMSASEALEQVAAARHDGANVFAETCPQYLYLSLEDHLMQADPLGAGYVCSTPLRSRHEHHAKDLWKGLRMNELAVVSTDHCPFCTKDKALGSSDFRQIPNGLGGVEHRMDLLYQGVVTGHLSLSRWVEIACTTPARMFGLYPKKGLIAVGADADIVLYDPAGKTRIGVETHHMNMDYSAFEGLVVDGRVDTVLSRGKPVIENGTYVGRPGHGRFIKRALSTYLV